MGRVVANLRSWKYLVKQEGIYILLETGKVI